MKTGSLGFLAIFSFVLNRLFNFCSFSSLLFISANGPAFELVEMKEYVVSWLMSGRQSALDSATHVAGKPLTEHREKLFL